MKRQQKEIQNALSSASAITSYSPDQLQAMYDGLKKVKQFDPNFDMNPWDFDSLQDMLNKHDLISQQIKETGFTDDVLLIHPSNLIDFYKRYELTKLQGFSKNKWSAANLKEQGYLEFEWGQKELMEANQQALQTLQPIHTGEPQLFDPSSPNLMQEIENYITSNFGFFAADVLMILKFRFFLKLELEVSLINVESGESVRRSFDFPSGSVWSFRLPHINKKDTTDQRTKANEIRDQYYQLAEKPVTNIVCLDQVPDIAEKLNL